MVSILNSLSLVDLGVPPLYETSTSIPLLRPALSLVSSPGHVFSTHDRSYLYHPRMDVYLKLDNIGWFGRVNECNTIVTLHYASRKCMQLPFVYFDFGMINTFAIQWRKKKRLRIDGFMPSSVTSVWHRFATTVWPCTDGTVSRNFWSRGIRWSSHPWWWTPCQFVQKGINIKPPVRIGIQHQPFH